MRLSCKGALAKALPNNHLAPMNHQILRSKKTHQLQNEPPKQQQRRSSHRRTKVDQSGGARHALQAGADALCRTSSVVQRVVNALDELAVDKPEVVLVIAA